MSWVQVPSPAFEGESPARSTDTLTATFVAVFFCAVQPATLPVCHYCVSSGGWSNADHTPGTMRSSRSAPHSAPRAEQWHTGESRSALGGPSQGRVSCPVPGAGGREHADCCSSRAVFCVALRVGSAWGLSISLENRISRVPLSPPILLRFFPSPTAEQRRGDCPGRPPGGRLAPGLRPRRWSVDYCPGPDSFPDGIPLGVTWAARPSAQNSSSQVAVIAAGSVPARRPSAGVWPQ